MRRLALSLMLLVVTAGALLRTAPVTAQSELTIRLSVAADGAEGNGNSSNPSISADGNYVAFTSSANNLVAGDTSGSDTFVLDRSTGALKRIPEVSGAKISGNGQYLAFASGRSDLVPGDSNGVEDVFVMDWQSGQTTRVSVSSSGEQGNASSWSPSISADGNYVAFVSEATNLVSFSSSSTVEANALPTLRVYLRDVSGGQTKLVSVSSSGTPANRDSWWPAISADGHYITFSSEADNLTFLSPGLLFSDQANVYRHDRISGETIHVSQNPQGHMGDSGGYGSVVSANGRYVAFNSGASDLVTSDSNNAWDVFLRDVDAGTTKLVSVGPGGVQGDGPSSVLSISSDGGLVAFRSLATNLVAGDSNGVNDIFVHNFQSGLTTRVSVGMDGREGNKESQWGQMSADGRFLVFSSDADNLVHCDTNGDEDVFLHDRQGTPRPWPTVKSVVLSLPPNSLPADGSTKADVSVLVKDQQDKPMGCTTVTFSLAPQLGSLSATSVTTGLDGRVTVQYTVPRTSELGSHTGVTVTASAGSASASGTINFASSCILVQDGADQPIAGAEVWRNGTLAGTTGADGKLCILLSAGDALVARKQVHEEPAAKSSHDGWAYRVYITSMEIPRVGEPTPFAVTDPSQEQVLTLWSDQTLIGFNIVASVEWDALPVYLEWAQRELEETSLSLYDATDGQMLFEQVKIYDNGQHWGGADYRIWASEILRSHAFNGGMDWSLGHMHSPRHLANQTMMHEFGHYGLDLRDSYFVYALLLPPVELPAHCTGPEIEDNLKFDTNATLMDDQFYASELSMSGVPGLWDEGNCTKTEQFFHHEESDWETVKWRFIGPGWMIDTPADHGGVVAGPSKFAVSAWSRVEIAGDANTGICSTVPVVTMTYRSSGKAAAGVDVYTYHGGSTFGMYQGRTDGLGQISILGVGNGDSVVAYDLWGGRLVGASPSIKTETISCTNLTTTALPSSGIVAQAGQPMVLEPAPFDLLVSASPGPGAGEVALRVVPSVALSAPPQVTLHQYGGASVPVVMTYDGTAYSGMGTLDATLPLEGMVEVSATDTAANTWSYLTLFAIGTVAAGEDATVWSADGVARLYVPAGSLPAGAGVGMGMAVAGAAPAKEVILAGPYEITTGASTFAKGANLSLTFSSSSLAGWADLSSARLCRWDGSSWVELDQTTLNLNQGYVSAPVSGTGPYAVLAEEQWRIYAPMIAK